MSSIETAINCMARVLRLVVIAVNAFTRTHLVQKAADMYACSANTYTHIKQRIQFFSGDNLSSLGLLTRVKSLVHFWVLFGFFFFQVHVFIGQFGKTACAEENTLPSGFLRKL